MKILPHMSKGIVFVHQDGKTFEMAPLQVWRSSSGQTLIRIGRNVLFFKESGAFDGTESSIVDVAPNTPEAEMLMAAFELQGEYKGLPPDEAYFSPGSKGYDVETASWPDAKKEDGGKQYIVGVKKTELDS